MFSLFKKKSEVDKLYIEHKKLLSEAFTLSKSDRSAGDAKYAEAEVVLDKIQAIENTQK